MEWRGSFRRRSEIGQSINELDLSRIAHVAAIRTSGELVAQLRHGDIRAVFFQESIDTILSEAVALRAREWDRVQLGRSLAERIGAVGHVGHVGAIYLFLFLTHPIRYRAFSTSSITICAGNNIRGRPPFGPYGTKPSFL